jgi:hypothetical protein
MEFLLSMKKKAKEGDATAQFTLGWTYELGKSVPQDYEIGFSWYIQMQNCCTDRHWCASFEVFCINQSR